MKALQNMVQAYNDTPNIGIENIAPNEATEKDNTIKLQIINHKKDVANMENRIKFEVGDLVKIRVKKNAFARSFDDKFSDKTYTIEKIEKRNATLSDGEVVGLRRLVKVQSTDIERKKDVLTEAKKESKVKKAIAREHLEIEDKTFLQPSQRKEKVTKEVKKAVERQGLDTGNIIPASSRPRRGVVSSWGSRRDS